MLALGSESHILDIRHKDKEDQNQWFWYEVLKRKFCSKQWIILESDSRIRRPISPLRILLHMAVQYWRVHPYRPHSGLILYAKYGRNLALGSERQVLITNYFQIIRTIEGPYTLQCNSKESYQWDIGMYIEINYNEALRSERFKISR